MASWWSAKPDEDRKSSWAVTNGNKRWPASTHPLIFSLPLSLSLSSYFFPHCYEIKRFVRRRRRLRRRVTIREYLAPCQPAPIQSILASNNSTAHPRLLHFHFFSFFLSFFFSGRDSSTLFRRESTLPEGDQDRPATNLLSRFDKVRIGINKFGISNFRKFLCLRLLLFGFGSLGIGLNISDRNKAQAKNTRRSSSISSFHPWYNICPRRLHCCRAMSMREVDYSKIVGRY